MKIRHFKKKVIIDLLPNLFNLLRIVPHKETEGVPIKYTLLAMLLKESIIPCTAGWVWVE